MESRLTATAKAPSSIFRRIASGAGAYGYAQAVSIGTQLLSLPLFLHYWDLETYGYWLALTAVPLYLSLADAGISTASCNRMIALTSQGKSEEAGSVFESAVAFLFVVAIVLLVGVCLVLVVLPAGLLSAPDWKMVVMMLSSSVILSLFCSLAEVIYKATDGYAAGTYLVTTGRLLEWAGGLIGLVSFGSYFGVAISSLTVRAGYTMMCIGLSHRRSTYLKWGVGRASVAEVRCSATPGLLFLSISLTNALSLQSFTLLVAATFGPATTTVFNTYRTVARIVVQVTNSLSNPLWPELTALHGQNDESSFWRLYRRANRLGLLIAGAGAVVVYLASPFILQFWTHGRIPYISSTMGLFLLYAAVCSATQVPRVVLMATNRHTGLAWQSLLAASLSLAVAWLIWGEAGMAGVVGAMVLGEALVWLTAQRDVRHMHSWRL